MIKDQNWFPSPLKIWTLDKQLSNYQQPKKGSEYQPTSCKSEREIKQRVAETALAENIAKLTPPSRTVAPKGAGWPSKTRNFLNLGPSSSTTTSVSTPSLAALMEIDAVELLKTLPPLFSKLEVTFLFKRRNFGVLRKREINLRTCRECEVEWSTFIFCSQRGKELVLPLLLLADGAERQASVHPGKLSILSQTGEIPCVFCFWSLLRNLQLLSERLAWYFYFNIITNCSQKILFKFQYLKMFKLESHFQI